jgi:tetratricopeptide (TPR) repeat protein
LTLNFRGESYEKGFTKDANAKSSEGGLGPLEAFLFLRKTPLIFARMEERPMKKIALLFILLGICFIFLPQACATLDEELCYYYFDMGNSCLSRGDSDCAIANYNKALEVNPRFIEAYYSRAAAWNIKMDPDRAIADCTKALDINPHCAKACSNRGVAWIIKKDYNRAITDFSKALKMNSQDANARKNRGIAWLKIGKYHRAITDFSRVLKIDPQDARIYGYRGIALWKMANLKEACYNWNLACHFGSCRYYIMSIKKGFCK